MGDIRFVPFGRVMCFILWMLLISSLYSSFRDRLGLRCGSSILALFVHSCSSFVLCNWKFSSMLLRWVPPFFFIRNSIRVVGDLIQSVCVILGQYVFCTSKFS